MTSDTLQARPLVQVMPGSAVLRVAGYLVLVDLFILPYFPLFIMPLSLMFVLAWAVCRLEVRTDRDLRLFFIIAFCVLASAGLALFYRQLPGIIVENFKRAGQFLTSFAYYFLLRRAAQDRRFNATPAVVLFLLWFAALAMYFFVSPENATFNVQRLYTSTAFVGDQNLTFFRFGYAFSDPNTAGYLVVMAGLFLLGYGRMGSLSTVVVLGISILGVVVSGSRGAALAMAVGGGLWGWRSGIIGRHAFRFAVAVVIVIVAGVFAFRWYAQQYPEKVETIDLVYSNLKYRLTGGGELSLNEVVLRGETSAGESRISTYRIAVTSFWPLPLGRGYELTGEYPSFRPHSDILRILYGYGFIALIATFLFFFRDAWHHELAIPAFMAFAFNTLIDEQKLLAAFLALLAIARVQTARARAAGVQNP